MKQLPRLWQRDRDGKKFGSFYVYIRNKPINLCTDDAEIARKRRVEAVRGGARKWPRAFRPKTSTAPTPSTEGTADALAALGEAAGAPTSDPGSESSPAQAAVTPSPSPAPEMGAPEVLTPEALPPAEHAHAKPAGDWAADVNAAGADPASQAAEVPRLRLTDFDWFKGAMVTASKVAVGLQLHAQAWAMRLVGDVEAGRVGPPPAPAAEEGAEGMAAFMRLASAPWDENDPREPGRRAYERTIVALIPEELPVPAWLKWLEAPAITAMNTAPIQWQTGTKIERSADGEPVPPPQPAQQEAPQGERAAA